MCVCVCVCFSMPCHFKANGQECCLNSVFLVCFSCKGGLSSDNRDTKPLKANSSIKKAGEDDAKREKDTDGAGRIF